MRILTVFAICLSMLITLVGCGKSNEKAIDTFNSDKQSETAEMQTERSIELLKEQYPEYFELSDFKGIEVYVWETAEGTFRCGMMSGTNRMKTAPEIRALEEKSLSIAETKMVLEEIGNDNYFVIPITQPYTNNASDDNISEPYIINEENAEQIYELFMK